MADEILKNLHTIPSFSTGMFSQLSLLIMAERYEEGGGGDALHEEKFSGSSENSSHLLYSVQG